MGGRRPRGVASARNGLSSSVARRHPVRHAPNSAAVDGLNPHRAERPPLPSLDADDVGGLAAALVLTSYTGGDAPAPGTGPAERVHVGSEACRSEAAPVVQTLRLAHDSGNSTARFEKYRAVEDMGSALTAQCSEALARPVREAIEALGCVGAVTLSLSGREGCPSVSQSLPVLRLAVEAAEVALSTTQ